MEKFIKIILARKKIIILGVILIVGIFLRTYNFKQWLYFAKDQARDSYLVESILKGELPMPVLGPKMGNTGFKLGPLFYYIKIINGKIFGAGPDKSAYPEVFFSILTIPLLYFFLNRYLRNNLSLVLTGLYAISFFAIRYSRFAWQLNLIPFFVLLFILSISEFLYNRKKTKWLWIVLLGITLGVIVQLHAILIIISVPITFLAFVYILKKDWKAWKKCTVIILIAIILNAGQIFGEIKNNFSNSKTFVSSFTDKSSKGQSRLWRETELGVACYVQANGHIISSLGEKDNCILLNQKYYKTDKLIKFVKVFFSLLFVLGGATLLIKFFRQEKDDKKKIFLGVVSVYSLLFFLAMIPVIDGAALRYYIHIFFLPYLFLGLIIQYLYQKFLPKYINFVFSAVIFFLIITNASSIFSVTQDLLAKNRSQNNAVILGEIEPIGDFIKAQSFPQNEAFLTGKYASSYFWPLMYLLEKKDIKLIQLNGKENIPQGKPLFDINSIDNKRNDLKKEKKYQGGNFGNISIYKLEN